MTKRRNFGSVPSVADDADRSTGLTKTRLRRIRRNCPPAAPEIPPAEPELPPAKPELAPAEPELPPAEPAPPGYSGTFTFSIRAAVVVHQLPADPQLDVRTAEDRV